MKTAFFKALVALGTINVALARDCSGNAGGVANGECVKFYGGSDCKGPAIGSYRPDCSSSCFVFDSFSSLHAAGDGTFGTDCVAYSDTNCQVEMTETGNVVVGSGRCITVPNAKSMKRFYRC
ncbi:hypothetical protein AURDEDRAFT_119192 [Auricularia subglabra TFB-10046 SS5]|nr:hypothetical protein AURDEDRAFT_119192 [Auricularia subglabra TFB-10046 SS5]